MWTLDTQCAPWIIVPRHPDGVVSFTPSEPPDSEMSATRFWGSSELSLAPPGVEHLKNEEWMWRPRTMSAGGADGRKHFTSLVERTCACHRIMYNDSSWIEGWIVRQYTYLHRVSRLVYSISDLRSHLLYCTTANLLNLSARSRI